MEKDNKNEINNLLNGVVEPELDVNAGGSGGDASTNQPTISEISNIIDDEEQKLLELEERRKRLSVDIEKLRKDIEEEKLLFRQAIDSEISKKYDITIKNKENGNETGLQIDPLCIDRQLIDECIESYRMAVDNEPTKDMELQQIKMNLEEYEKSLIHGKRGKIEKNKLRAEADVFQRHLKQLGDKCNAQKDKLDNVRKYIDKIQTNNEEIATNINEPEV